ncbi:MAG: hypothetical protein CVV27_02750 [Candidatus Melainabacteria bacterium HGW-Melainabacteria-1]|nr:MAG: hypothetical protein CVV27_02750 [Candidatus Melainabacteria bacterium HGW-Melainabacteria-1]
MMEINRQGYPIVPKSNLQQKIRSSYFEFDFWRALDQLGPLSSSIGQTGYNVDRDQSRAI